MCFWEEVGAGDISVVLFGFLGIRETFAPIEVGAWLFLIDSNAEQTLEDSSVKISLI